LEAAFGAGLDAWVFFFGWSDAAVTGVAEPDTSNAAITAANAGGVFLNIETDSLRLPPRREN
jgi:hypothetical protein